MKINKLLNMTTMLIFILGVVFVFSSCSSDDDDSVSASSENVTITCTKGSKVKTHYNYTVSVKYSGNASDVKVIGINWGKGSNTEYSSTKTESKKTFSKTIELYDGERYTIEGFVKLKSGETITSKKERLTP